MYIDDKTYQRNGTTYRRVLLRYGKRISSKKTKLYTIANLSNCSEVISVGKMKQIIIPKPTGLCKKLLDKANVIMSNIIPYKMANIHTNRKLMNRRK